jgi:hypothetical protein
MVLRAADVMFLITSRYNAWNGKKQTYVIQLTVMITEDKVITDLLSGKRVLMLLLCLLSIYPVFAQGKTGHIYFENFTVPVVKISLATAKPLNFKSNPDASMFRTRIAEAYQQKDNVFAGHFKVALFGCGAGCVTGFAIDMLTGNIYNLPLGEEGSCMFAEERALFKAGSSLFVSGVCKENPESNTLYYTAFIWKEDKDHPGKWKFESVPSKEFLSKKTRVTMGHN